MGRDYLRIYALMDSVSSVLSKHHITSNRSSRPVNVDFEEAREFGSYVGLNTIFVLKLFKKFGKAKVLNLRSFIADVKEEKGKTKAGLIYWKLKNEKS